MQTDTATSRTLASFVLTDHARRRMSQRGIRQADLREVLNRGRCCHAQGARFYFIGRKEVRRYARQGVNLERLENLQVVVSAHQDTVITVYRNPRLPRH